MATRTVTPINDGVSEQTSTPGDGPADTGSQGSGESPYKLGPLLECEESEVAAKLRKMWDDKDPEMAYAEARWKANSKRRAGVIGVVVVKPDPDKSEYKVWAPPGASRTPPTFNQAARLCRRFSSMMLTDKPVPECTPGGASDSGDPDRAEFSTRILQDVTSGKSFNLFNLAKRAISRSHTYDSGFVRFWTDPRGGGHRPKTIQASAAATTVDDAVWISKELRIPQPLPYVTRYVKPDGQLTDNPRQADLEWLPGLRGEVLTGKNVRFLGPATGRDDADGIILMFPKSIGDLRKLLPDVLEAMPLERQWAMVKDRPGKAEELIPSHMKGKNATEKKGEDEPPPDDAIVIVTCVYFRQGGEYPEGAYVMAAGKSEFLHRQHWIEELEDGRIEELEIPIAQFAGWDEGTDDPYKFGLMHFLGPGNEIRAAVIGNAIEHLDRFNRRKVFYSPNSLFQPKTAPAAMGTYVAVESGTEPKNEQVPEYPRVAMEIFDRATNEMTDESGIQGGPASGQTSPEVTSGLHAQTLIEQVAVGLSDPRQNIEDGFVTSWRICLQQMRCYFTANQRIQVRGDDQSYKEREWRNTDLSDTRDVRLMKGSFTMLAPSAKMAVAEYMFKLQLIDRPQLKLLAGGNIGGTLGLQDDPVLLRCRGQISEYFEGPPGSSGEDDNEEGMEDSGSGVEPPDIQPDPLTAIQTRLQEIFEPLPVDKDPENATLRFREFGRALCKKKHLAFPPEWRQGLEWAYADAQYYSGHGTMDNQAANQLAAAGGAPGAVETPGAVAGVIPPASAPQLDSGLDPASGASSPLSASQQPAVA